MDARTILAVVDAEDDVLLGTLAWRRIAGLAAAGARVETVLLRGDPSLAATLRHAGIVVHASPSAGAADWRGVRELARVAHHAHAAALYAMGRDASARAALAAPLAGIPAVLHPWAAPSHDELAAARLGAAPMLVTTASCAQRAALVGVEAVRVEAPTCPAWPEASGDERVVAWYGSARETSRPRLFGAIAAGATARRGLRYAMTFLGSSGATRTWSGATVRAETHWHAGLLDGSAVFVHTGVDASAPTALIDALASPLPVVLPAHGFAEALALRDGVHAFEPDDPTDLERAIGAALATPRVAPAPASIDACGRRVLEAIAEAVARRRALSPASAA
jgi:hypothetical protein